MCVVICKNAGIKVFSETDKFNSKLCDNFVLYLWLLISHKTIGIRQDETYIGFKKVYAFGHFLTMQCPILVCKLECFWGLETVA
jgi:hypothetical protein